ncbi:MAG: TM1266 family iron-only hydrogenase system putative regulator [Acutalibacteraceae bacterium]
MDTRVAILGIIVEKNDNIEKLNGILSRYSSYIIGRMGIPYNKKSINIISVALDAPTDVINDISGKIGSLDGISAKTAYSKI